MKNRRTRKIPEKDQKLLRMKQKGEKKTAADIRWKREEDVLSYAEGVSAGERQKESEMEVGGKRLREKI